MFNKLLSVRKTLQAERCDALMSSVTPQGVVGALGRYGGEEITGEQCEGGE